MISSVLCAADANYLYSRFDPFLELVTIFALKLFPLLLDHFSGIDPLVDLSLNVA